MTKNLTQLSKFLALILRHTAREHGISIDSEGFTDIETVWTVISNKFGKRYTIDDLYEVVAGDQYGKKRYEIVDTRIRAMFGHSDVGEISYPVTVPPKFLYHGTSIEAIQSIKTSGLMSQNRQYVHLTTNFDNATRVANRHSKEIIVLEVSAKDAYENGVVFHQPEAEHFLCKAVPSRFIIFPHD